MPEGAGEVVARSVEADEAVFVLYVLGANFGNGLVIGENEAVIGGNFDRAGCHEGLILA